MTVHIEARFEIANWDESPFDDGVGVSKLTEALVTKKYSGDVDGTSTTKWLMAYAPDKTATYVGIERIKGTVGGKRGSLVLLHDGFSPTAPPRQPCAWCRAPTNCPTRQAPASSARIRPAPSRSTSTAFDHASSAGGSHPSPPDPSAEA